MNFDFSHLYKTETVEVKNPDGSTLFTAVIREIKQGEKTAAQTSVMSGVNIAAQNGNKKAIAKEINHQLETLDKGEMSALISLKMEVAAIESWTLKDAKGKDVPVCLEAWQALPVFYASQLEEVIERINTTLDAEFQRTDGNTSES